MKTKLIQIGNSQGLRIPKSIIEQLGLDSELELTIEGKKMIIQPSSSSRTGWAEAFEKAGSEESNIEMIENEFDKDWTW